MNLDREQLEALKRQIEEEYRLDMAAIERLQRRISPASAGAGRAAGAVSTSPAYLAPVPEAQAAGTPSTPVVELPQDRQPDELTGTLRAMFSSQRR